MDTAYWISTSTSITAAIICAIGGFVWRAKLRSVASAIASLFRLHSSLSSIGMVRFVRDRQDYKHHKSDGIARYVRTARRTVHIVGINLMTGVDSDDLLAAIRDLVTNDRPVTVHISLLDPESPTAMAAISNNYGKATQELAVSITSTLRSLAALRRELSDSARDRFVLKAHSTLPFASAIMIDVDEPQGELQLETKPYRQPINRSLGFTLRNVGKHNLYGTLSESYKRLIDDARLVI